MCWMSVATRGRYDCRFRALFMKLRTFSTAEGKGLIADLQLQVQICTKLIQIPKLMTKMNDSNLSVIASI